MSRRVEGPLRQNSGNATKKVRVIMAVSQSLGKNTMASESIAFFEGRYMPTTEAKISIVDPAVTKSDIVFDVVSATGRVFFRTRRSRRAVRDFLPKNPHRAASEPRRNQADFC